MADDGFDPCECMWSHELAMRRLLSMLRNSQSDCTDSQCFAIDGQPGVEGTNPEGMLFMVMAVILALFMFFMRPRMQRRLESSKPNFNDSNGAPPAPPPTAT